MRKTTATILSWLMAVATAQQAPQAPKPAQPDSIAKFSANAQLVVETVSVVDKNGKPIEGLKAEDFKVTENGAPQTIKFLEFQKFDDADDTAPAPTPVAAAPKPVTPPPPGTVATAIKGEAPGDIRYKNRRLLGMYFDMSAMPVPDQLRAFAAAQKFLKSQVKPADLVAIMKFDTGAVKVLQDF